MTPLARRYARQVLDQYAACIRHAAAGRDLLAGQAAAIATTAAAAYSVARDACCDRWPDEHTHDPGEPQ